MLVRQLEAAQQGEKGSATQWGEVLKYLLGRSAEGARPGPGAEGRRARGRADGRTGAEGGGHGVSSAGSLGSSQRAPAEPASESPNFGTERDPTPPRAAKRGAGPRSGLGRPRDGRAGARPRPAPTALPSPVSSFPRGSAEFIHWDWFQVTPSLYF